MDFKRKGFFLKSLQVRWTAGVLNWRFDHTFIDTMGKELISEINKNYKELSLCLVCFLLSSANNQI